MTPFGSSIARPLMSPSRRPSLPPRRLTSEEASAPGFSVTMTRDHPLLPARLFRSLSSFSGVPDLASAGPPSPTTRASASTALVRLRCHRITIAVSFRCWIPPASAGASTSFLPLPAGCRPAVVTADECRLAFRPLVLHRRSRAGNVALPQPRNSPSPTRWTETAGASQSKARARTAGLTPNPFKPMQIWNLRLYRRMRRRSRVRSSWLVLAHASHVFGLGTGLIA